MCSEVLCHNNKKLTFYDIRVAQTLMFSWRIHIDEILMHLNTHAKFSHEHQNENAEIYRVQGGTLVSIKYKFNQRVFCQALVTCVVVVAVKGESSIILTISFSSWSLGKHIC